MTESEWLQSEDPSAMLKGYFDQCMLNAKDASHRKLHLFAVAVVKTFWAELTTPMRRVVEVAERMADGLATDEDLYEATRKEQDGEDRSGDSNLRVLIHKCAVNLSWNRLFVAEGSVEYALYLRYNLRSNISSLLRDIVGNVFRPVMLPEEGPCPDCPPRAPDENCDDCGGDGTVRIRCSWLTPEVTAMTRAIYDDRSFDLLPILADLLEESRCHDDNLLRHLRGPNIHVRGCWALDALLGKS